MIKIQINENILINEIDRNLHYALTSELKSKIQISVNNHSISHLNGIIKGDIPTNGNPINLYVEMDNDENTFLVVGKLQSVNTVIHIKQNGHWVIPCSYRGELNVSLG